MESPMPWKPRSTSGRASLPAPKDTLELTCDLTAPWTWSVVTSNKRTTRHACIVDAHISARKRHKETQQRDHEDRIADRGSLRWVITTLCTSSFLCARKRKIWTRKPQSTSSGANWRTSRNGERRKSKVDRMSSSRFILRRSMGLCHLKNSVFAAKDSKTQWSCCNRRWCCKRRFWILCRVFTEQGSSASQMTAAKVLDVIARQPGCEGQASDAVFAYTKINMEDASTLLNLPKSECPEMWIRLPRHTCPETWESIRVPAGPPERKL